MGVKREYPRPTSELAAGETWSETGVITPAGHNYSTPLPCVLGTREYGVSPRTGVLELGRGTAVKKALALLARAPSGGDQLAR